MLGRGDLVLFVVLLEARGVDSKELGHFGVVLEFFLLLNQLEVGTREEYGEFYKLCKAVEGC